MATPDLDRLFETLVRRELPALVLVSGAPPAVRMQGGLGRMQIDALTAEDVATLAGKTQKLARATQPWSDYSICDVRYGDAARFRVAIVGGSEPRAVIYARVPPDAAELTDQPPAEFKPRAINFISVAIEANADELYLAPGVPPLVRTNQGIHAFRVPALSEAQVTRFLHNLPPRRSIATREGGSLDYDVHFSSTHWLRLNIFDQPTLSLAAIVIQKLA